MCNISCSFERLAPKGSASSLSLILNTLITVRLDSVFQLQENVTMVLSRFAQLKFGMFSARSITLA